MPNLVWVEDTDTGHQYAANGDALEETQKPVRGESAYDAGGNVRGPVYADVKEAAAQKAKKEPAK